MSWPRAVRGGYFPNYYKTSCGTVFELSPPSTPGGAWTETTLHEFGIGWEGKNDGLEPWGTPIFGKYGALYGTTTFGGSANDGTVFSIQP